VSQCEEFGFRLRVEQSFGNCPKYITERVAHRVDPSPRASQVRRSTSLSHTAQQCIASADTFFIATGYRGRGESLTYGMDASHRGGPQGFVRVLDEATLVYDDYAGNNHYNTLGNLSLDPRTSLLFVDFERGGMLQLRGRARIGWEAEQRTIRFELDEALERPHALPLRWSDPQANTRKLRVTAIRQESADVRSLLFESEDGRPLEPFLAGQYLPVSLSIPGSELAAERTYSLSNSPRDEHYRISVKREPQGLVSQALHDRVRVGDVLKVGTPSGSFVLDPGSTRPAVLLSAGVGLTPMVAMLHELAGSETPVVFVHGARDAQHHSLREEVRGVANAHANVELHVRYSRPGVSDVKGLDYDSSGRLDAELLEELLPGLDADFYLCGPAAFLADLHRDLRCAGVPVSQIHSESF
jgi:ferredoxin-NADP reductase/predicted pyridoxine 5'-phosphate oxidase superfamily flavin-nucleotide-binding protein